MEMFENLISLTEEEMALEVLSQLDNGQISLIMVYRERGFEWFDSSWLYAVFPRQIRNYFHLWDVPWVPEITDGVDYSPNHPDAVSGRVIERIKSKIRECCGE